MNPFRSMNTQFRKKMIFMKFIILKPIWFLISEKGDLLTKAGQGKAWRWAGSGGSRLGVRVQEIFFWAIWPLVVLLWTHLVPYGPIPDKMHDYHQTDLQEDFVWKFFALTQCRSIIQPCRQNLTGPNFQSPPLPAWQSGMFSCFGKWIEFNCLKRARMVPYQLILILGQGGVLPCRAM